MYLRHTSEGIGVLNVLLTVDDFTIFQIDVYLRSGDLSRMRSDFALRSKWINLPSKASMERAAILSASEVSLRDRVPKVHVPA